MRKITTLIAIMFVLIASAQAPQGFNYQATVRNSSGVLITNQNVLFKFNLMIDSQTSSPVYSETHFVTTDDLGHVNLVVGTGTPLTGSFTSIDWGAGVYYLGIELNTGAGLVSMGTSQLFSVPYALYSQTAGTTTNNNQDLQAVLNNGNFALTDLTTSQNNHAILLNSKGGSDPNNFYRGFNSVLNNQTGQTLNGQNRAIQSSVFGSNDGTAMGLASFVADAAYTYGVYGIANTTSNYNNQIQKIGVWGLARDMSNANTYGVAGTARDSETTNIGVGGFCTNGNTTAGTNYGLYANVNSVTSTGNNYGVYSTVSNGVNNYAGYFNGDVTITGTLVQPSDRKLKREIKPLNSTLEKINQLVPVSYYYEKTSSNINLPTRLQYGFIAQDLESIFPELVVNQTVDASPIYPKDDIKSGIKELDENLTSTTVSNTAKNNSNGQKEEFKGINYTGLISILTEGIKEQQAQIKLLLEKVQNLEKEINLLKNNK
jgi:hypothetical protein